MEHYYVMCGNEFGLDLDSKRNFKDQVDATNHFNETSETMEDDGIFGILLVKVDVDGKEEILDQLTMED